MGPGLGGDVMAVVTLSTLAYRSLVIEKGGPGADGDSAAAGACQGVRDVADRGANVFTRDPKSGNSGAPHQAEGPSPQRLDALEHEARGLLNLIGLLSKCLGAGWGSQSERLEWRMQVADAELRLDEICQAGVPRNFDTATPGASGRP